MICTVKFQDEITHESIEKLISKIEEIRKEKEAEKVVIYFASGGGSVPDAQVFLDFINSEPARYELVGYWNITSAAFNVFMEAQCKKRILDYTFAMLHLMTNQLDYLELQQKDKSYSQFHQQELKRENEKSIKLLQKLGLTDVESEIILHGGEVYLNDERIREMIEIQTSRGLGK